MNRHKIVFLMTGIVVAVLLMSGFIEKAFAHGSVNCCGSITRAHLTPSIIMPPPMPPGFPNKWVGNDLIQRFNESGLEIETTEPVNKLDYSSLPARAKEAIKITVPSIGEEGIGCILSFEVKHNMEEIKRHYLEKNKKEELYSWTFAKDNILVVLNGVISEDKARMFESVLNQLN